MSLRDRWWRHRHPNAAHGPSALAADEVEDRLEQIQRRLQLQGIAIRDTRTRLDEHIEEDDMRRRLDDVERRTEEGEPHAT